MMGRVNLRGRWHTVSGAHGSDGLPMTVDALPNDAKPLPRELYDGWNKGGGWNSSGNEAPAMRLWAREEANFVVREDAPIFTGDIRCERQFGSCAKCGVQSPRTGANFQSARQGPQGADGVAALRHDAGFFST
jgi:hypothetical protein